MSDCCPACGMDRFFSRSSARYARRFRRKGPDKPSAMLIDQLVARGLASGSVLDVGCGTGNVHLTLLQKGAMSAVGVDVSSGMLEQAATLAEELGLTNRVQYHNGDLASTNGAIAAADIVVMDKVLCCYADPQKLLDAATARTKKVLALTYPRASWLAWLTFTTMNRLGKMLRWSFHPFYHDPREIEASVLMRDFTELFSDHTLIWDVKIFGRNGVSGGLADIGA